MYDTYENVTIYEYNLMILWQLHLKVKVKLLEQNTYKLCFLLCNTFTNENPVVVFKFKKMYDNMYVCGLPFEFSDTFISKIR